jgi:transposase InsO family protein
MLRTDNGGEFYGKDFQHFCKHCVISCQNTTPYTLQKNGFVERMNGTLMDKARSMLGGVGIAQELWKEAANTRKYLVNMSPSSALINSTPHEVWSGKKI